MTTRDEALERMREHAERAEEMLAAAEYDMVAEPITWEEREMALRAAQVHATLALYWQGEVRDMVV